VIRKTRIAVKDLGPVGPTTFPGPVNPTGEDVNRTGGGNEVIFPQGTPPGSARRDHDDAQQRLNNSRHHHGPPPISSGDVDVAAAAGAHTYCQRAPCSGHIRGEVSTVPEGDKGCVCANAVFAEPARSGSCSISAGSTAGSMITWSPSVVERRRRAIAGETQRQSLR